MNRSISNIENQSDHQWDENESGPPLHTRIAFASAWILIAVAGTIGKRRIFREECC